MKCIYLALFIVLIIQQGDGRVVKRKVSDEEFIDVQNETSVHSLDNLTTEVTNEEVRNSTTETNYEVITEIQPDKDLDDIKEIAPFFNDSSSNNGDCKTDEEICKWDNGDSFRTKWQFGSTLQIESINGDYTFVANGDNQARICKDLLNDESCLQIDAFVSNKSVSMTISLDYGNEETVSEIINEGEPRWKSYQLSIAIPKLIHGAKLCINGFRNQNGVGQIAFDNIALKNGKCANQKNKECSPNDKGCRWSVQGSDLRWIRVPFNLNNNGVNWALQAPLIASGTLISPSIQVAKERCLRFNYYKAATNDTWLNTLIKTKESETMLYSDNGNSHVSVKHININIARNQNFKVIFNGKSFSLISGTYLKNVIMTDGVCGELSPAEFLDE